MQNKIGGQLEVNSDFVQDEPKVGSIWAERRTLETFESSILRETEGCEVMQAGSTKGWKKFLLK